MVLTLLGIKDQKEIMSAKESGRRLNDQSYFSLLNAPSSLSLPAMPLYSSTSIILSIRGLLSKTPLALEITRAVK